MESHKTLGILGGGQLGRMSAQAAKPLGIKTIILTPERASPASQVADETIVADYDDKQALNTLAEQCDVITYEFENIPIDTVRYLKQKTPVYPDDNLLEVSQDRLKEKAFLNEIGIHTANWLEVKNTGNIKQELNSWKTDQLILKTTRFGYDGKGQARVKNLDEVETVFQSLNTPVAIAESIVDFEHELSVIVARDHTGNMVHYGPMLNHHKNHILDETLYPATISEDLKSQAVQMTLKLAEHINLRGVLCLELFVTKDGSILANEIAPRTHNSGHWTIDATDASQFENHVRAVCGLPLIEPNPRPAGMINLIGDDIRKADNYTKQENACVHTYGKQDIKTGRKMGHVTFIGD